MVWKVHLCYDRTLFLKKEMDQITCSIIYVDDMVITGNDAEEIRDLKKKLSREFDIKDLKTLKDFLSIEVLRSQKGIFISQLKYILDLLAETDMRDCKPAETPIAANHGLQIIKGEKPADKDRYRRMVRKHIYLSHIRPDIAYAVGVVSIFMHMPEIINMTFVMRT